MKKMFLAICMVALMGTMVEAGPVRNFAQRVRARVGHVVHSVGHVAVTGGGGCSCR